MRVITALTMVIAGFCAVGNAKAAERYEFDAVHMGTKVRIVLYAPDKATADAAAKAAFDRIAAIEDVLSDYKETSEIMKLAKADEEIPGRIFRISDDLNAVMTVARELSEKSDGTFDVTIGPLSQIWRKTKKEKTLPTGAVLDAAKEKVGWKKLVHVASAKTLQFLKPGMRLDFGGIGKGYAADAALLVLKGKGISSALVAMSGDIAVSDAPPGKDGWTVDIAPLNANEPPRTLLLVNAAVSTSGDLFQHVEIAGVRYSHVLDPKTGLGLTGYRSVTVVAKQGIHADSLCKAASLLPWTATVKLMADCKAECFSATKADTTAKVDTHQTVGFEALVKR